MSESVVYATPGHRPGQVGSGPGQSMAEIIDNIDYEASKSQ